MCSMKHLVYVVSNKDIDQACWPKPLIPAIKKQKQADLSMFEDSLVFVESSRLTKTS